jgi:hypothetical protein
MWHDKYVKTKLAIFMLVVRVEMLLVLNFELI